jgi:hypothetical protein
MLMTWDFPYAEDKKSIQGEQAVLVSHRKQFIFTKTVKTAGTSVESYFEKYCMPEGEWQQKHSRAEYVSESGVIGYRGPDSSKSTWYNHMPAAKIRDLLGQEVWDSYYKFTTIRNPFDKLISGFYMFDKRRHKYSQSQRILAYFKALINRGNPIDRAQEDTDVERFRSWIKKGGIFIDRDKYMIDGHECVDWFIRFEDLHTGMKHVCDQLAIPFDPSRLPQFKTGFRTSKRNVSEYYDQETAQIVRQHYAWELDRFGYSLPD